MAIGASEHSVELPDGRYPAAFEIVHQLHCLNFIRMASYEDYYKEWALPWHDKPETVRVHLGKFPYSYRLVNIFECVAN